MYYRYKSAEKATKQKPSMEVEKDLKHGSYGGLLFDKRWQVRRSQILAKDHHRCVVCQSINELQVHHRQYHYYRSMQKFKSPWDYPDKLLITLCENCHRRGHSKFKVPIIYI